MYKIGICSVSERNTLIGCMRTVEGGYELENAAVVRRWGTNAGLGQLAEKGPQSQTVLDSCGKVFIPTHALLLVIEANEKVWDSVLSGKTKTKAKK